MSISPIGWPTFGWAAGNRIGPVGPGEGVGLGIGGGAVVPGSIPGIVGTSLGLLWALGAGALRWLQPTATVMTTVSSATGTLCLNRMRDQTSGSGRSDEWSDDDSPTYKAVSGRRRPAPSPPVAGLTGP